MYIEKIKQLKLAIENLDIETQMNVVLELLQSDDREVIFAINNALAGNTSLFLKYVISNEDIDVDTLREDLIDIVECLLEYEEYLEYSSYGEVFGYYDEYSESQCYVDNMLDYYKEYERKAFGRNFCEGNAKGYDYREVDDEDLDY